MVPRQGALRQWFESKQLRARRRHVLGEPSDVGAARRLAEAVPHLSARHATARARRPPTAKATEVYSKYVITDMYAKAAQGTAPARP